MVCNPVLSEMEMDGSRQQLMQTRWGGERLNEKNLRERLKETEIGGSIRKEGEGPTKGC